MRVAVRCADYDTRKDQPEGMPLDEALNMLVAMELDALTSRFRTLTCRFEPHDIVNLATGEVIVTFDPLGP